MKDNPIFTIGDLKIEIGGDGFLYILFSGVYLVTHLVAIPTMIANMLIAVVGLLCLIYVATKVKLNRLIVIGVIATLLMSFSMLFNSNADIYDILWIWAYMGVGALIYYFTINPKLLSVIGYTVLIIFLAVAIMGREAENILTIGSRNNISTFVIFFISVMFLSQKDSDKSLAYIPALGIILISIWTNCRGGILAGAVCLGFVVFNNVFVVKKQRFSSVVKWIVLAVIAFYFTNKYFGQYILELTAKLDRYGNSSVRTEIWKDYWYGVTHRITYLLFGVPGSDSNLTYLHYYSGNTHNAFIMLHSKFGIVGFLFVVINTIRGMLLSVRKNEFVVFVAIITIIARSMFDWTGFPGLYDVIFWYLILYVMDKGFEYGKVE